MDTLYSLTCYLTEERGCWSKPEDIVIIVEKACFWLQDCRSLQTLMERRILCDSWSLIDFLSG